MKRKRSPSNAPLSTVFLPQELIIEILSFLHVKSVLRLKCLSKSWKILISNSNFVDKHLKNSSLNPHLTISWYKGDSDVKNVIPILVKHLLKKQSATVSSDNFHMMKNCQFIGSCNGLFCFLFHSSRPEPSKYWLRISNPATRTISEELGLFCLSNVFLLGYFEFTFGYVASTRTYKVVAFRIKKVEGLWNSEVKVFNLGDNSWKSIQSFPVVPLKSFDYTSYTHTLPIIRLNDGVHFNGTVNWFALDKSDTHGEQFVIVSLDLSMETYMQFWLPPGYNDVPFSNPILRVWMDCLCFSHDSDKTEFVLWKMKEYGIQESWTQLFKISYQNLAMQLPRLPMHIIEMNYAFHLELVCLYVKGDTVIFISKSWKQSFIYNLTEKTFVRIKSRNRILWLPDAKDYVESLVSVR